MTGPKDPKDNTGAAFERKVGQIYGVVDDDDDDDNDDDDDDDDDG